MQKVKNKKCIQRLSGRSLMAAKGRNIIAVIAIALTAVLFTALFTIALSLNQTFQEQNFRLVGGTFHGAFKNITKEQAKQLREHPLIRQAGYRIFIGMPTKQPFNKCQVEISYAEPTCASAMFCVPKKGRLPKEGTLEAATDTKVLKLLGVTPKLGEKFTVTYPLGESGEEITQTFTLCGWWEYDEAMLANHILVAESYVEEVLKAYEPAHDIDMTGRLDLNVNFKNAFHIEENLKQVLADNGYQSEGGDDGKPEIAIGVNWGYTGAQYSDSENMFTWLGIAAALLLIMVTGYMIIYNIFRISVTGDIRFYGLLKTIGTTGRQIRAIILRQALLLSCIGIPLGLIVGWFAGAVLTPVVMSNMSYHRTVMSTHPAIFLAATLFALATVFISCYRPARLASKVSPIEAVRYTEGSAGKKKHKKGEGGAKVWRMAFSNLERSKTKTALVVLSLSLALVILNLTYMFTSGFDMDKYIASFACADFVLGSSDYFQVARGFRSEDSALPESAITAAEAQGGIAESGRIYGQTTVVWQRVEPQAYLERMKFFHPSEQVAAMEQALEPEEDGMVIDMIELYGMEEMPLSLLTVLEGDLEKLSDPSGNYIAAVVMADDYGNALDGTNHCKVGDELKVSFIEEFKTVDSRTGEDVSESTPEEYMKWVPIKQTEKTYTVAALVDVPNPISYRHYGLEQYVLSAEEFIRATKTENLMTYLMNTTEEGNENMEAFLKEYTEFEATDCNYESKQTIAESFEEYRNMFLLMGGALGFIIGLIGILNFMNAEVTSIISRKREFAVLEAVGMTGKQLQSMLILEGVSYGVLAIIAALLIDVALSPLIAGVLEELFWFYAYKFTALPILLMLPAFVLLGIALPLLGLRFVRRQSVVERIREAE